MALFDQTAIAYLSEKLMPVLPRALATRPELNRRLGIKSSLPKPRTLIAAVLILWVGAGYRGRLEYADSSSDGSASLKIDNALLTQCETAWAEFGSVPAGLKDKLEESPLFKIQLEPLQVALELIWKIAEIKFVDEELAGAAERTGNVRRLKVLKFSVMMDILKETLTNETGGFDSKVNDLLFSWLSDIPCIGNPYETKLIKVLSVLTEDVHFKAEEPVEEFTEFQQEGIYKEVNSGRSVWFGRQEKRGPLRIFNKILELDLHPYLQLSHSEVTGKAGISDLPAYAERVSHYLNIVERHQKIIIESNPSEGIEGAPSSEGDDAEGSTVVERFESDLPKNWIVFGAPGTGKSHFLDKKCGELKPTEVKRIIFHSDYTYSHFVGGYRPIPIYDPTESKDYKSYGGGTVVRPGKPVVEYGFVAGPLLDLLIQAQKNPQHGYLLIIEELNRADAPAVFGDIFQLLDRTDTGESKYQIRLSKEATEYLQANGVPTDVKIPSNLFLWATMNNADQGVMPLDTAFKRRWQYEYIGIDQGASYVTGYHIPMRGAVAGAPNMINWDELRRRINQKLKELRIHEDMHIGPFFLKEGEMLDDKAFKFKLLAYLRDDILRHRADEFFSKPGATLSELIDDYEKGNSIFSF